jgi:hypothetical protein
MKYLKRFNEELKPQVYRSAARAILKSKLPPQTKPGELSKIIRSPDKPESVSDETWKRVTKLRSHSDEIERKQNLIKWKDNLQDYLLFGSSKLRIANPKNSKQLVGDFAFYISFDELSFEDNYQEQRDNEDGVIKMGIPLFVGIIPTSEDLIEQCDEVVPEPEFDNGFYWAMCVSIDFEIDGDNLTFTGIDIDNYDTGMTGDISFVDKPSARRFLQLLKNIFSKVDLNYPSGYTDETNFYKKLEQVILIRQGFSADYGFNLEQVSDFIQAQISSGLADKISE